MANFSEWLESRGIDEATLTPERSAQLMNFHKHDQEEAKLHPASGKDCSGADVNIGDMVNLSLKVTGLHTVPADEVRGIPEKVALNLAIELPEGGEGHLCTITSELVSKVK